MRIRVLTAKKGLAAGTVIECSDAEGKAWIGTGDGEDAKGAKLTRQAPDVETADADPTKK